LGEGVSISIKDKKPLNDCLNEIKELWKDKNVSFCLKQEECGYSSNDNYYFFILKNNDTVEYQVEMPEVFSNSLTLMYDTIYITNTEWNTKDIWFRYDKAKMTRSVLYSTEIPQIPDLKNFRGLFVYENNSLIPVKDYLEKDGIYFASSFSIGTVVKASLKDLARQLLEN
jgi:hypothetical protein